MLPPDSTPAAMSVAEEEGRDCLPHRYNDDFPGSEMVKVTDDLPPRTAMDADVISVISEANSMKSSKSKKRVQFLPEGQMVRVRVIPARSNKSSSDSDGSASDSSSESEDSDTETEDSSCSSRTPSPAVISPPPPAPEQNEPHTPPLMWGSNQTAKGSYALPKSGVKTGNNVARITGIRPAPTSCNGTASNANSRRARRTPSPKLEKRAKKSQPKTSDKASVSISVRSLAAPPKSKSPRKSSLSKKDGKTSPPAHSSSRQNNKSKQSSNIKNLSNTSNSNSNSNTSNSSNSNSGSNNSSRDNSLKLSATAVKMSLAQRRINSAPLPKSAPIKRSSKAVPIVSDSLTSLPSSQQAQHTQQAALDRVGRSMQNLTMGQLYTIDGFIFPSHQAPEVHLPDVFTAAGRGSEDLTRQNSGLSNSRSGPAARLSSPRRSIDLGSVSQLTSQVQISPSSAARKKRQAWQMAEGGAQTTLHNTLCIAQLWDQPDHSGTR